MFRGRILILALFMLAFFVILQKDAQAGANTTSEIASDVYQFPVLPGSKEWQAFNSHAEMLKATHIPTEQLKQMSTSGLVETTLNYPLYGDMLAYNNLQQGFDAVANQFNGLTELLNRPDVGSVLVKRYQELNPAALDPSWSLEQQGFYDMQFTYIEVLLAQNSILATLTDNELQVLLVEGLNKVAQKQQQLDIYGWQGQEQTIFLLGRVLLRQKTEAFNNLVTNDPDLNSFLSTGSFANQLVANKILGYAQQTLNNHSPLSVLAPDDYSSTVKTPNNSNVTVIVKTYELTSAQIAAYNQSVATNYPNATRKTDASRKYNCHSYAWHSTSSSNNKWMNSPGDDTYWNDGSYTSLGAMNGGLSTIPSWVPLNARISYPSYSDHSAIKISSGKLRSKWGQYPQMEHAPNYSPYSPCTNCSFSLNVYNR